MKQLPEISDQLSNADLVRVARGVIVEQREAVETVARCGIELLTAGDLAGVRVALQYLAGDEVHHVH